jgi:hypothetical protein
MVQGYASLKPNRIAALAARHASDYREGERGLADVSKLVARSEPSYQRSGMAGRPFTMFHEAADAYSMVQRWLGSACSSMERCAGWQQQSDEAPDTSGNWQHERIVDLVILYDRHLNRVAEQRTVAWFVPVALNHDSTFLRAKRLDEPAISK